MGGLSNFGLDTSNDLFPVTPHFLHQALTLHGCHFPELINSATTGGHSERSQVTFQDAVRFWWLGRPLNSRVECGYLSHWGSNGLPNPLRSKAFWQANFLAKLTVFFFYH